MYQPLQANGADIRQNLIYRLTRDVPFEVRMYEDDPGPIIYDGVNQSEKIIFPEGTEVRALFCGPQQFKSHGVFSVIHGGRVYTTWIDLDYLEHVEGNEGFPESSKRYMEDGDGNLREVVKDVAKLMMPYFIDRESLNQFVTRVQELPLDVELGIMIDEAEEGYEFNVFELVADEDE